MDDLEKKLKELMSASDAGKDNCPDEQELAALADGALGPEESRRVLDHLAGCARCLEAVRISMSIEDDFLPAAPARAVANARALFKPTILSRIRMLFSGLVGRSPALQPSLAVRGGALASARGLSSYSRDFGKYHAEVEVEKVYDDKFQVYVWMYEKKNKKTVSGPRVSLRDKNLELESLVIEKGRAAFEPVTEGDYLLKISRDGRFLAGISIRMKGYGK